MRRLLVIAGLLTALMSFSCSTKEPGMSPEPGSQKRATVMMKDGTTNVGSIVSSSDKEITIAGDDKITRTIPMDQVRSIEYIDAAPAAQNAAAPVDDSTKPEAERDVQAPAAQRIAPAQTRSSVPVQAKSVAPAPAAQVPKSDYELLLGTRISVRTFEMIDSSKVTEGQTFPGEVTKDVLDKSGNVVIPARSNAQIGIKSATRGGRIRGASDLVVDLRSITVGGKTYSVVTTDVSEVGKSGIGANKRTATYTGGGAAVGAIIGAIAGGGKGAAIGAASGAGAGALTQIITKGSSIKIPAETVLGFRLEQPVRIAR